MSEKERVIQKIIDVGKRLDSRGLNAGTNGNVSARLSDGSVLITASGKIKGLLKKEDVLHITPDKKTLSGSGKISSESNVHLTAYEKRDEINAVIHAHAPHVIALCLAGYSMEGVHSAEAAYEFGSVPTCPFAVAGTDEGGDSIKPWVKNRDAMILDRHGAVTLGADLWKALARMEMMDNVAYETLLAGGPEKIIKLNAKQIDKIYYSVKKADTTLIDSLDAWRDKVLSDL